MFKINKMFPSVKKHCWCLSYLIDQFGLVWAISSPEQKSESFKTTEVRCCPLGPNSKGQDGWWNLSVPSSNPSNTYCASLRSELPKGSEVPECSKRIQIGPQSYDTSFIENLIDSLSPSVVQVITTVFVGVLYPTPLSYLGVPGEMRVHICPLKPKNLHQV